MNPPKAYKHFESIPSFARYCHESVNTSDKSITPFCYNPHAASDWYQGLNSKQTLARSVNGDESLVAGAEALLHQIEDTSQETEGYQWSPAVAGAYPCVPEYLAGEPQYMRIRSKVPCDRNPIRIFASFFVSSGIDTKAYVKRGHVLTALLMKLQQYRPIDLVMFVALRTSDRLVTINVDTKPLDLSSVSFALTHPAFFRHFGNGMAWMKSKDLFENTTPENDDNRVKTWLGFDSQNDIYIPGHTWDGSDMITNPIKWVNSKVQEYSGLTND